MKDPVLVYHNFNVMVMPAWTMMWHVPVPAADTMQWITDTEPALSLEYESFWIERYVHNNLMYHMVKDGKNHIADAIPRILMTAGQAVNDFKKQQQLDHWTPIEIVWDMVCEDPNVSDLLYASAHMVACQMGVM